MLSSFAYILFVFNIFLFKHFFSASDFLGKKTLKEGQRQKLLSVLLNCPIIVYIIYSKIVLFLIHPTPFILI